MEGNYTLFDEIVRKALKRIDDALQNTNYSVTGGINVQLLIANKLCARTGKDLNALASLEDSFLLRETGDIDVIVDSEITNLADILLKSDMGFDYEKLDSEEKRIDYQTKPIESGKKKGSLKKEPLQITFYATPNAPRLKSPIKIESRYRGKTFSVKGLSVEDLIIQKLDNDRPKDNGDVERLMLVYGSEIDENYINKTIAEEFGDVRADSLLEKYQALKKKLTENK